MSGYYDVINSSTPKKQTLLNIEEDRTSAMLEGRLFDILIVSKDNVESCSRRILRISFAATGVFLSYATLIPSILTANTFNPFPGASTISSLAVIVNFGTFGAVNYIDLSNIIFTSPKAGQTFNCTVGKTLKIFFSCFAGVVSRFPGAGIALHVAPGIPANLRPWMAGLGILGTCSPEIVSMYNTLEMDLCSSLRICKEDAPDQFFLLFRENLLKSLFGLRQRILQLPKNERIELCNHLFKVLFPKNKSQQEIATDLFLIIMSSENHSRALASQEVHRSRKWIRFVLGTSTTIGTCCALVQNAYFTKFAFDYFFPSGTIWKWGVSGLCSMTIAHTSFKLSFLGAYQWFDTFSGLWGNKQNTSFAESSYYKSDFLISAFAAFWAFALFGILYESAKSSVDLESDSGKAFFSGNFFASFFLIYMVMQNIMRRGITAYATNRYSGLEEQKTANILDKLNDIEEEITTVSLDILMKFLKVLHARGNITIPQQEMLLYRVEQKNIDSQDINFETIMSLSEYNNKIIGNKAGKKRRSSKNISRGNDEEAYLLNSGVVE